MRNVAVVPVKSLSEAKKRLSARLSPDQRRKLVLAMLQDVLHALSGSSLFSSITVISPDASLEKQIENNHVAFMKQTGTGLNAAVRQATRQLSTNGYSSMTTVLADLPLATRKDFRELIEISQVKPRIVLAPSLKGGTNVMVRYPPEVIPPSYGRWSYAKHLRAGQKRGIPAYSISNPRLSFDVDTIKDLKSLRLLDPAARTHAGRFALELDDLFSTGKNS